MAYSLGIDLGTTYSAAATAHDDRVEIFQLGERAATIPSIVVLRADGEVLTGDAAERRSLGEPTRTAREFKRRLGDPTPIILGGTPYGAEALLAHLLAGDRRPGDAPSSASPRDSIVVTHPASYGAYKIDLLRAGHPPGRHRQRDAADRARGGGRRLRRPGARPGRRGHRRLRLRWRHVRRHDPAQDRDGLRAARPAGGHGAPRRHRLRRGALHRGHGQVRDDRWRRDRPERPGDAGGHRAPPRGVPAGQGGALVRHRHDDRRRPARPPDRDAPDP